MQDPVVQMRQLPSFGSRLPTDFGDGPELPGRETVAILLDLQFSVRSGAGVSSKVASATADIQGGANRLEAFAKKETIEACFILKEQKETEIC